MIVAWIRIHEAGSLNKKERPGIRVVQEGVEMGDVEAEAAGIVFSNMLRT